MSRLESYEPASYNILYGSDSIPLKESHTLNGGYLNWLDKYVHDPIQHESNPMLIHCSPTEANPTTCIGYLCTEKIDLAYCLMSLSEIRHPDDSIYIPRNGDMVVGIEKDERIESITIIFNEHGGGSKRIDTSEMFEFKPKYYCPSMEDISGCEPHKNQLFDPKFRGKDITIWYWPFNQISTPCTSLSITTTPRVDSIKVLYALLDNDHRDSLLGIRSYKHNGIIYEDGYAKFESTL